MDITNAEAPCTGSAFMCHFELKSIPEMLWKYSRNRGNYRAIMTDISFNETLPSRLQHFKNCIAPNVAPAVHLSVPSAVLKSRIKDILSSNGVKQRYLKVQIQTKERYKRLLDYLPIYFESEAAKEIRNEDKLWLIQGSAVL
ncbi:MAG TPA: hypothetical protein VGC14_07725 [Rhizobium sp.]